MKTRDPRDFVTPDAFAVAPELLGRPLAGPWRRAAATTVDGFSIAVLSNLAGIVFGAAAKDLGLGFGWSALYFTAFLVLWRGQTRGKRLLKIRVLRLNGTPIGWWAAITRFGGYAAGLATGLLGYLQVLWDPNRQAVHDEIAETVVVKM